MFCLISFKCNSILQISRINKWFLFPSERKNDFCFQLKETVRKRIIRKRKTNKHTKNTFYSIIVVYNIHFSSITWTRISIQVHVGKKSTISSEFFVWYYFRRNANSQSLRQVRHSTISGVRDILRLSNIRPDKEKADSEEMVDTSTLRISRANTNKIGNSTWLSFYHFRTSRETWCEETNLEPKYLSISFAYDDVGVQWPPVASATSLASNAWKAVRSGNCVSSFVLSSLYTL